MVHLEHSLIWELALFTSSVDCTSLYSTNIIYTFIYYIKHSVPVNLETATIFALPLCKELQFLDFCLPWRCIYTSCARTGTSIPKFYINPLNAELNPICHLLALLGAHLILHVSRIRVKVCSVWVCCRACNSVQKVLKTEPDQKKEQYQYHRWQIITRPSGKMADLTCWCDSSSNLCILHSSISPKHISVHIYCAFSFNTLRTGDTDLRF